MIANIVKGASFAGCTKYAYGKDEAEVIAFKDIIPDNHITAANGFDIQARMNKRVSNPVGHISISFTFVFFFHSFSFTFESFANHAVELLLSLNWFKISHFVSFPTLTLWYR